jgi:hypothetical protein
MNQRGKQLANKHAPQRRRFSMIEPTLSPASRWLPELDRTLFAANRR